MTDNEEDELKTYSYINNGLCFEYFVGYEIASLIGYKNPNASIIKNVSKSNQLVFKEYPGAKYPELDPRTILITRDGVIEILLKTRKRISPDVLHILKKFQIETTNKKCLTKEQQTLSAITNAFKTEKFEDQYKVDNYYLDLYFTEFKIVVECDENGHSDRKPYDEEERMAYVNEKLEIDATYWIRYNPDEYDFDISKVIGRIYRKIDELKQLKKEGDEKRKFLENLEEEKKRYLENLEEEKRKFLENNEKEYESYLNFKKNLNEDEKREYEKEIEKIQTLKRLEEEWKDEEDRYKKRWSEVISEVGEYTDKELNEVIAEFSMKKRKGRPITRRQVKTRLEKQMIHPEIYLHDDQYTDNIKNRIVKNIDGYDEYELQEICRKYTLPYYSRIDDMRKNIRDFIVNKSIVTQRKRNVYKYDTTGELIFHYNSMSEFCKDTGISRNSVPDIRDQKCVANNFIYTSEPKIFSKEELDEYMKVSKKFRKNLTKEDHKNIYNRHISGETNKDLMEEYNISRTQFLRIINKV